MTYILKKKWHALLHWLCINEAEEVMYFDGKLGWSRGFRCKKCGLIE